MPTTERPVIFANRAEAGRFLAHHLRDYAGRSDVLVLGLPRGGVPVAFEVARSLRAPLDAFVVRKIGVPGYPELAIGAIASGDSLFVDEPMLGMLGLEREDIAAVIRRERLELQRRESRYCGDRCAPDVRGRTVILVDDGLATGSSMRVAVAALRERFPARIVAAVPIGSESGCHDLASVADDVVCVETPEPFGGVGAWYRDFSPTSDAEVVALLARAT